MAEFKNTCLTPVSNVHLAGGGKQLKNNVLLGLYIGLQLPSCHIEMFEDDTFPRLLLCNLPQLPLAVLDEAGVEVLVGGLQDVPVLLGILNLPAEAARVVNKLQEPGMIDD